MPDIDHMPEESITSKIAGHQAMIDQMYRMIEANKRELEEMGGHEEGRERMIKNLTNYIAEEKEKIAMLEKERDAQ